MRTHRRYNERNGCDDKTVWQKKTENIHEYWDNECQKQVICI